MAETEHSVRFSPLTLSRDRHGPLIAALAATATAQGCSTHFAVYRLPEEVVIVHDVRPDEIDNNISGLVAGELLPILGDALHDRGNNGYRLSEQQVFEGCVGAIVRSIDANERRAWHRFYDNTLRNLADQRLSSDHGDAGVIAEFRAIYRTVARLIRETEHATVLDVATCFGFLPLFLAAHEPPMAHIRLIACDLNPALVALAEDYREHRGIETVAFVRADILAADLSADLGAVDQGFDVVTAIHLLEHLTADESARAIETLWALTRRRLIIAVPFEAEPDARFGHRQVFDGASLARLAARTDGRCRSFEHHGGWLVIDRAPQGVPVGEKRP